MGAKWSVDGSYTLGEQLNFKNKLWKIYPAESRTDDVSATVFIHDKEKDECIYGVEKAVKYLRTLRHPGLLKCHEVFDNTEELSVVTEAVVPLENVIGELNTQEIIAGIHGIITTVTFLHKCKLSHNNLCLSSIFVGQNDACWKIAGFECMLTFVDMTSEFLTQIKPFRELESIPPEEEKIELEWAHAQDSFGLGKLIWDIFHEIDTTEEPTIDNFQLKVEAELLHHNYQERPQVSCLLNDDVFQNGYIEILEFLNNITVKSNEEKGVFFRDLHNKLQDLSPKMVANRLLHLLLSRLVLVEPVAVEIFLPHLLTPLSDKPYGETDLSDVTPLLPRELYKESCLPILRKLFDVKDRHVRMILLKYFHLYVGMFEKDVLQKVILDELMLGLHDSDDELVSLTFSALQHLVPLLGSKIVIGGERTQQFTERRPKVEDLQNKSMPCLKDDQLNKMTLLSKAKQDKGNTVEDKIKDHEKKRQETRKRNEERRKQNQLLQMQKLKAKKANEVEDVHYESDNDFESWEELSPDREQHFEVSDGSEHGRPSSSENLSLDSGFSERIRIPSSNPVSPRSLSNKTQRHFQTNTVNKTTGVKGGMKLGKSMQKRNQINANLSTSNCDAERTMTNKNKRTKNISSKSLDKKKTIDTPWEDYEINVMTKNLGGEDLFADMTPSLISAPTAPVKGTSIYSDKLSVESQSNEVTDGWNDEEW